MNWLVWPAFAALVVVVLALWTAFARCTLASFEATTGMRTRVSGPNAHTEVVTALSGLPGVRVLERSDQDVLLSVRPAPASPGRGWGLYLVVRPLDRDVLLLARRRVPLPGGDLAAALRELERAACQDRSPFADS